MHERFVPVDMPTATSTSEVPRSHSLAAVWIPALLVLGAIALSAITGRGLDPSANAASVGVQATVPGDLYLDATACSATALAIGDLVPGTDPWKTAQDEGGQTCGISFGTTNSLAGTTLFMLEDPGAPAAPADAMKCVGASCGTDAIADFAGGAEPPAGTSAFGAQLLSAGDTATPSWSTTPAVHDVADAASAACATPTTGNGTCEFTWGATASTSDLPGAYQAQARLVVMAN